jgi:hypothetical protein
MHLPLIASIVMLLSAITISIQSKYGMPSLADDSDPKVLTGMRGSSTLAWKVLGNITAAPHSTNTRGNQEVKLFLLQTISALQEEYNSWKCESSNPIEVHVY